MSKEHIQGVTDTSMGWRSNQRWAKTIQWSKGGDVKIIMDSQSAPMLVGSEVEYLDTLQGSGFAIKNPQAKTTCGCGSSFNA